MSDCNSNSRKSNNELLSSSTKTIQKNKKMMMIKKQKKTTTELKKSFISSCHRDANNDVVHCRNNNNDDDNDTSANCNSKQQKEEQQQQPPEPTPQSSTVGLLDIDIWSLYYRTCIASNEPTPFALVQEKLPLLLETLFQPQHRSLSFCSTEPLALSKVLQHVVAADDDDAVSKLKLFLDKILIDTTTAKTTTTTTATASPVREVAANVEENGEEAPVVSAMTPTASSVTTTTSRSIREIQVQIMIRLDLYSLLGETFLSHHAQFVRNNIRRRYRSYNRGGYVNNNEKKMKTKTSIGNTIYHDINDDDEDDHQQHPALILRRRHGRKKHHRALQQQYKTMSSQQILVDEIVNLVTRASVSLWNNHRSWLVFCRQCLFASHHWFDTIPHILQDILQTLELPDHWKLQPQPQSQSTLDDNAQAIDHYNDYSFALSPMQVVPSKKRTKTVTNKNNDNNSNDNNNSNKPRLFMSLLENEYNNNNDGVTTTTTAFTNTAITSCTTGKKRNSLIKDGGKPRLLASHFNAATKLIRTVSIPRTTTAKTKGTMTKTSTESSRAPHNINMTRQQQQHQQEQQQPNTTSNNKSNRMVPQRLRSTSTRYNNTAALTTTTASTKRKLDDQLKHDKNHNPTCTDSSAGPGRLVKRFKSDTTRRTRFGTSDMDASHGVCGDGRNTVHQSQRDRLPFKSNNTNTVESLPPLSSSSSSPRNVVMETPVKQPCQRPQQHPRTPLGALINHGNTFTNYLVQETPTKEEEDNVDNVQHHEDDNRHQHRGQSSSSPLWDRSKLVTEASHVLRRRCHGGGWQKT